MSGSKNQGTIIQTERKTPKKSIILFLIILGVIISISMNIYYCFEVETIRSEASQLGKLEKNI